MPESCDYNCADLPEYEQISCGAWRKGGFGGYAVIECDHTITDWSSSSEWTENIEAGRIRVFGPNGIKASLPDPSPVEGENPNACGAANIVDSYDRTVMIKDFNINATNIAFYNALNKRNALLAVYDGCNGSNFVTVIETPVVFNVFRTMPENNREKQFFTVNASYTEFDMPMEYEAPAGIFV